MKYFFTVLMALTILFGIGLTVTPYIMEFFWPVGKTAFQSAKPEDTRHAVADWFAVPVEQVKSADSIRKLSSQGSMAWFRFSMPAHPVANFIGRNQLQQLELTSDVLQQVFLVDAPSVDWWQPDSLGRETYFKGNDGKSDVALIYNAEQEQGFMLVKILIKQQGF